jgi:methylmalonyl-CoA mutase
MSKKDNENLFKDFNPVTREQWKEKIIVDLKGADYNKKLVWNTHEGFAVEPFYMKEDIERLSYKNILPGEFPYVRGKNVQNNNWLICQNIYVENITEANKKALDVLNKGVQSILFVLKNDSINSKEKMFLLLDKINIEKTPVSFSLAKANINFLEFFITFIKTNKYQAENIKGFISIDPLSYLNKTGGFAESEQADFEQISIIIKKYHSLLPNYKFIHTNAALYTHAGASSVQDIAFALSMGVEYISRLTGLGVDIDTISAHMQFRFGISNSYFMQIAKLRAVRYLWAKLIESYSPASQGASKMCLHSETAFYRKTNYDSYVNMLRTTTEAMSAILAGTDSLCVHAFDINYKKPSEFSERIARNQQLIIKDEASFDKVVDPAAGSYYIETLTESLIEEAWNLFLQIEEKGGYVNAFKEGFIQKEIKRVVESREIKIAKGGENILGTNQFPNAAEKIEKKRTSSYMNFEEYTKNSNKIAESILVHRAAESFEKLRRKTEESGKKPKVFMFTIGHPAMRSARSQFSSNFFACAGFGSIDNKGFKSVEEGITSAKESNAEIVVVCSSDDEYAEILPPIFEALKDNAVIVVAGAPACADELKAKGIHNFINIKSPLLETLEQYQNLIGI